MQIMQDAIICHLFGDEKFFDFAWCVKSSPIAPTFGAWTFVIQLRFLGLNYQFCSACLADLLTGRTINPD
jgi:hypothetical protein